MAVRQRWQFERRRRWRCCRECGQRCGDEARACGGELRASLGARPDAAEHQTLVAQVERRGAVKVAHQRVGACVEQQAHDVVVALLGGNVQRRAAAGRRNRDGLAEERDAILVDAVHVGAVRQQQRHNLAAPHQCGQVQRSRARRVERAGVGAEREQLARRSDVVERNGHLERPMAVASRCAIDVVRLDPAHSAHTSATSLLNRAPTRTIRAARSNRRAQSTLPAKQ